MTNLPSLNLLLQNSKLCVRISTFKSLTSTFHLQKPTGTHTIIALEPDIPKTLPGILVNTDTPFNKDFYTLYRNAYSSYDAYAIGTNGRIADFFSIYNWETSMKQ